MGGNRSLVLLLRGINLGPHKRVPMPALRELLADGGFENVRTYVQSGNVVLSSDRPPDAAARLESLRADPERLVIAGRELYTWHPQGVARSKLWTRTAGKDLGVVATARNWTTVTTLLAMADEE